MKATLLTLLLALCVLTSAAQSDVSPLFQSKQPVEVKLGFSIKDVKKITNDTIYTPTLMSYKKADGQWDSLKVDLRARGEFRRKNCFFPPIRLRMKKKDADGTLFAGNKSLKLVVPCQTAKTANDLIIKEYLAYKLYEPVTPYYFNTRMVDLTLTDNSGKGGKSYQLKGIFIEDDGLVAKRHDAKMVKNVQLHPLRLADTVSTLHDFFEYMIANTDWSAMAQHNIKVMQLKNGNLIPLTYDFDMAGIVNAPYAQVSELLDISSVKERVYRGFCRSDALFEHVRQQYIKLEPEIMKVFSLPEIADLNPKELAGAQKYIGEFFTTLKNDRSYKENILSKCRTN